MNEVYFGYTNGEPVLEITKENVSIFREFLQKIPGNAQVTNHPTNSRGSSSYITIRQDVTLNDIIKDEHGAPIPLQENAEKYLGRIVSRTNSSDLMREAIDAADTYPALIATAYNSGRLYDFVRDTIAERPVNKNLAVIDALVTHTNGYEIYDLGQPATSTSLSDKEKAHFKHIYELGKKYDATHDAKYYPASTAFQKIAKEGHFVNTNMPADMRADYNDTYFSLFGAYSGKQMHKRVEAMNAKHFRVEDVARIVSSGAYYEPNTNHDTSNAKTQAEKNVNIIPDDYKKLKKIILQMAENEPSVIPNSRGETRNLTQKVQSLAVKLHNIRYEQRAANSQSQYMTKVTEFEKAEDIFKSGIIRDALLSAARTDIENGQAEKIDLNILQAVASADKRGYYTTRLPQEVAQKINLTHKQVALRQLETTDSATNIQALSSSPNLPTKKKNEALKRVQATYKEKLVHRQELETLETNYNKDIETLTAAHTISGRARNYSMKLERLQKTHAAIKDAFKDGKPNKNEAHLQEAEIEKMISSAIKGERISLMEPQQGSLPLFGRSKEQTRRQDLSVAVRNFNETLHDIMMSHPEELKAVDGFVLSPEAIKSAKLNEEKTKAEKDKLQRTFDSNPQYESRYYRNQMYKLQDLRHEEKILDETAQNIQHKIDELKKKSKENVGVPDKSPLKAVTDDMDKDTKTAVRRQNRSVKDKLAEKATQKAAEKKSNTSR